jgi:hypothetical protein
MQRTTRVCLAFALVGVFALGASQTTGYAADFGAHGPGPRYVAKPHWRVGRRVVVRGCVEVSQPPRGCPVRLYGRLPWPGVPRFDEAYYESGWHRCWWGEWC